MDKPWGYEEELKGTPRYSLWKLHINEGQETSLHMHPDKDVFLVLQEGLLEVRRGFTSQILTNGGTLLIDRGVPHRLRALCASTVLEVEWPNDRDNIVRLEDKYGRCA